MNPTGGLPEAPEAEQCFLGALLMDESVVAWGLERVKRNQFKRVGHQTIYAAIQAVFRSGDTPDPVSVYQWLKERGQDDGGDFQYLCSLVDMCPSSKNLESYIKPIAETAAAREMIAVCDRIRTEAMSGEIPASDILGRGQQEIMSIGMSTSKCDGITMEELLAKQYRSLMGRLESPGAIPGIGTGLIDLDNMTGGMRPGEVIIIGGRPKMGKSALADQIGDYVATTQELPVVMFSYEMSAEQLAERRICSRAETNSQHYRRGSLEDDEKGRLADEFMAMRNQPRIFFENRDLTVYDMQARVQRVAAEKGGVGLIIVDYIQLVRASKENDSRPNQIFEVMRGLSSMAMKLQCPVIALSQLVNEIDKREDKRPHGGDYRDGGAILSEAHIALLLYREGYYKRQRAREMSGEEDAATIRDDECEIIVAAQRNGPVGTIRVNWQGEYVRFRNLAPASWGSNNY